MGGNQVFRQHVLVLLDFLLFLVLQVIIFIVFATDCLGVFLWVSFQDQLLDVAERNFFQNKISHLLSFSVVGWHCLFNILIGFFGNGRDCFFSLQLLVIMGIPINKMPPKSFAVMENIIFSVHHLIGVERILFHILYHLILLDLGVALDDFQWSFSHSLPYKFDDLSHVLVDIPAINGFHEVLNHLHNKQKHVVMLLGGVDVAPELDDEMLFEEFILKHDTEAMQALL